MHTFKAGDYAMVRIAHVGERYAEVRSTVCDKDDALSSVPLSALSPLPEPLTELEREFIESWFSVAKDACDMDRWERAKIALSASRAPADPWKELEEATEALVKAECELAREREREVLARLSTHLSVEAARARYAAALAAVKGEKK